MARYRNSASELEYACSGPAGRARWSPGIGHGRELFPYGTSSHTHGYTIDFINPDWYLLGKKPWFSPRTSRAGPMAELQPLLEEFKEWFSAAEGFGEYLTQFYCQYDESAKQLHDARYVIHTITFFAVSCPENSAFFRKNRQFFENIPRKILHIIMILNILEKCCIWEKSRKKLVKFGEKSAKFSQNLRNSWEKTAKNSAIFNEKFEIRERCKGVHCVDLGESFPTSIYLQKSASIQPRTSRSKFGSQITLLITYRVLLCVYRLKL